MVITTRSKRSTFINTQTTPETIGPGSYKTDNITLIKSDKPSYTGFQSTEKRDVNINKTTSGITPGPGAYNTYSGNQLQENHSHTSSFTTKVSRFAPTAPGSTIFTPSTSQTNPGPGSYNIIKTMDDNINKNHVESLKNINYFVFINQTNIIPTIPSKEQSYGYKINEDNGTFEQKNRPNKDYYSGLGHDTVGPAFYDASSITDLANEINNKSSCLFGKSRTKREIWENNSINNNVSLHKLGPDKIKEKNGNILSKKEKMNRPNAIFLSKVPILPEPKRLSEPIIETDSMNIDTNNNVINKQYNKLNGDGKASFGSKSNRNHILAQPEAPFSTPSYIDTPGPGYYTKKKMINRENVLFSSYSYKNKKVNRDNLKEQHVGFQATTPRHCLDKTKTLNSTGPGSYQGIHIPGSLAREIHTKKMTGRKGVFGTTSKRELWKESQNNNQSNDIINENKPASNVTSQFNTNHTYISTTNHIIGNNNPMRIKKRTPTISSFFKSSSSRFVKLVSDAPNYFIVGQDEIPGPTSYNTTKDFGYESNQKLLNENSTNISFMSNTTRDHNEIFRLSTKNEIPGPGAYDLRINPVDDPNNNLFNKSHLTRSNKVRSTMGDQTRFQTINKTPIIGPGTYKVESTMVKKSFNTTLKLNTKEI